MTGELNTRQLHSTMRYWVGHIRTMNERSTEGTNYVPVPIFEPEGLGKKTWTGVVS